MPVVWRRSNGQQGAPIFAGSWVPLCQLRGPLCPPPGRCELVSCSLRVHRRAASRVVLQLGILSLYGAVLELGVGNHFLVVLTWPAQERADGPKLNRAKKDARYHIHT